MSELRALDQIQSTEIRTMKSYPFGQVCDVQYHESILTVSTLNVELNTTVSAHWHCSGDAKERVLTLANSARVDTALLLAALDTTFTFFNEVSQITLQNIDALQFPELIRQGVMLTTPEEQMVVKAELFWQQSQLWLTHPPIAFPLTYQFSQHFRHPLRPQKPTGTLYQRYIPWLDQVLSFRTVDQDTDLDTFNRWMNDPVVAEFWQEEGDLDKHHAYLTKLNNDPHMLPLIASFDDESFGYFEVYWAKEDRIAPYYDVHDFDRGWHVLIGEAKFRGKPYVSAWMPAISHYLFLDDCRTQRLVIEPRSDNKKMIRNLARSGYALVKEFDFPHKRAMLGMLLRERFFSEGLWNPNDRSSPLRPLRLTAQD